MASASNRYPATLDFGLLLIRIVIGVVFFFHGAQKLFGWFGGPGLEGTEAGFAKGGIPYPMVSAVLAGGAEFVGGLALILGVFMRILILPTIFTMGVAVFHAHWDKGFSAGQGGYEYPLTLGVVMLGLVFTGAGRYALYEYRPRK